MSGGVPVREIALLRDALIHARAQDAAARDSLEVKAQEFETLFNSSPIGLAFAQDPGCSVIWHNTAMDGLIGPRGSHRAGAGDGAVRTKRSSPLCITISSSIELSRLLPA